MMNLPAQLAILVLFMLGQGQSQEAGQAPPEPPPPMVKAELANYQTVWVAGPGAFYDSVNEWWDDWSVEPPVYSPDHKFALIRFFWGKPKYWGAEVRLVSSERILKLNNSMVREVAWTPDGKYIIGFGDNLLRAWDTTGKINAASFDFAAYSLGNKGVCVYSRPKKAVEFYRLPDLEITVQMKIKEEIKNDWHDGPVIQSYLNRCTNQI